MKELTAAHPFLGNMGPMSASGYTMNPDPVMAQPCAGGSPAPKNPDHLADFAAAAKR